MQASPITKQAVATPVKTVARVFIIALSCFIKLPAIIVATADNTSVIAKEIIIAVKREI